MAGLTNTTQEEMCAIVALAKKAKNSYGELYDTANQYEIVMKWAKKWFANKEKSNKYAQKWNKEHPERHKASNERWYAGFKERMKNDPEFCEKQKAYRKKYYEEVLKPKRQAKKEK